MATIVARSSLQKHGYQVAPAPDNKATIRVINETKPVISISASAQEVNEGNQGNALAFPVSVINPASDVMFKFSVSETGNFVEPGSLGVRSMEAEAGNIEVNLKDASDDRAPESIVTVQLLNDFISFDPDGSAPPRLNYSIGSASKASTVVLDKDIPASGLSLVAFDDSIVEGEEARFQIRTVTPLANDATVKVRIENVNNRETLIDRNETIDVVLPAGQRSVDFSVETQATWGVYRTQTTQFKATLRLNGGQYTLATGNENIEQTITASNRFSTVTASLAVDKTTVTEGDGQLIQFALSLTQDDEDKDFPSAEILVQHVISQTGGNFIYVSESSRDSATGTKRISFTATGARTKNIILYTQVDAGNSNGSISLEVVTNTQQNYYSVSTTDYRKSVTVNDNGQNGSQVSISSAYIAGTNIPVTTIREGDVWGVKVTIDPPASYPMRIALSTVATGEFLAGSNVRVIHADRGLSSVWLYGSIETDDIAEPDGTLTISVLNRSSYTIDSNNNEVVYAFKDNDQIPTLSFTSQSVVVDENVPAAEGDNHGKMVFGVELSHASVSPVVVNYAVGSTGLNQSSNKRFGLSIRGNFYYNSKR